MNHLELKQLIFSVYSLLILKNYKRRMFWTKATKRRSRKLSGGTYYNLCDMSIWRELRNDQKPVPVFQMKRMRCVALNCCCKINVNFPFARGWRAFGGSVPKESFQTLPLIHVYPKIFPSETGAFSESITIDKHRIIIDSWQLIVNPLFEF